MQAEPTTFGELGVAITSAGSDRYISRLAHDYLTAETERKVWIPQLAAGALSAERGTWRVYTLGCGRLTLMVDGDAQGVDALREVLRRQGDGDAHDRSLILERLAWTPEQRLDANAAFIRFYLAARPEGPLIRGD